MRLGRNVVALCAAAVIVAAAVMALGSSRRMFVATAIAVVPLAWAALAGTVAWWLRGREARVAGTSPAQADAAASWLAGETAGKWREEAASRRIVTPAPASVRWRWADGMSVPSREVTSAAVPGTAPAAIPGLAGSGELLTSGVVTRLHDEVYARLPHGRLVLVGGPGSGKTAAMILLMLAALDRRGTAGDGGRPLAPVPVWLTMGGWNPLSESLAAWVVKVLNRDYPAMRAAQYGDGAATALLRSGRLALFLDGLDELPADLRAAAVQRINGEGGNLRIVLSSRPAEYRLTLEDAGLDNGAVIELRPVRPAAAAAFLLRAQTGPARARWQRLADYIRANPASVLAAALDNPLALSLARDAYTADDPAELADSGKFPTSEAITARLIDQFLRAAYPDARRRAHNVRWLSWIAARMGASQDLRWWDIPGWVPRWRLRLTRALLAGAVTWIIVTPAAWLTYEQVSLSNGQSGATSPAPGIAAWAAPGYAVAVAVAIVAGLAFPLKPASAATAYRSRGVAPSAPAGAASDPVRDLVSRVIPGWRLVAPGRLALVLAVLGGAAGYGVLHANGGILAAVIGALIGWFSSGGWAETRNNWRWMLARAAAFLLQAVVLGLATGIAAGLWAASLEQNWVAAAGFGFFTGAEFFSLPALVLRTKGFGRMGAPRSLTPRWPRPRWLLPLWIVLSPLLIPRWLGRWAAPAADSPSATAGSTYRSDRRTSAIYASVYAALVTVPFAGIALAFLVAGASFGTSPATPFEIAFLPWSFAIAPVVWLTTWLGAGEVPLMHLTQLVLLPRRGRVSFRRLLNDGLDRQVLRQAGAVYQFRHAALQARLADHNRDATSHQPEGTPRANAVKAGVRPLLRNLAGDDAQPAG